MQQQVNTDEIVINILNAMYCKMQQSQIEELKNVLYMFLGKFQIFEEETALCSDIDDNIDKFNIFLANLKIEGKSEKTIKAYAAEYRVAFNFFNKNFRNVTTNDVRMYLAHCKTVRKNGDVTLNNKMHYLMSLFKFLTVEEYITRNPMLKIHKIKVETRIKEILTDEQAEIVRCGCKNERDLTIIDILTSTGMRVGEMVQLNRTDIDFVNGQCIVFGKGRKERPVYLNGRAKVHLFNYLESRTDDDPALFVSIRKPHTRLEPCGIRAIMDKISSNIAEQQIHINPHKLRRTMATNMINRGAAAEHVQKILGHTSVQTTLDCYANLSAQVIREAHRRYVV